MKRFLLISDIHACDVDPGSSKAPSYVSSFRSAAGSRTDPIAELEDLIRREDLQPECILCPGDITNKSLPDPFGYAWERLHDLAEKSGAKLIATVGNHDVDSRYKSNAFDPRGYAMSLKPSIPTPDRLHFLEYWAENFTPISLEGCNIVALNTAAFHGNGRDAANEIEHGRISDSTLSRLGSTLASLPKVPVNILLCHHHVIKPERSDEEFKGLTRGGHGYGGSNAPVVLGCASFSAQINEDAQNKNPNQVHLLICDPDGAKADGLTSCGSVMSWTWQPGVGWRTPVGLQGLPYISGYGYWTSVDPLVDAVDAHLNGSGVSLSDWDAVATIIPGLRRLIPADFERLERAMERRGLVILSEHGRLRQVGRRS